MEKANPKLIEKIKKQIERIGDELIFRDYTDERGWYIQTKDAFVKELIESQLDAEWVKESLDLVEHAIKGGKGVKDRTVKWYMDSTGSINAIVFDERGIICPEQCWNDGCSSDKVGPYMLRWAQVDAQRVIDGYCRANNIANDGTVKANDKGLVEWYLKIEKEGKLWDYTHSIQHGYDFDVYKTRADALQDVYSDKIFEKNPFKLRQGPITESEQAEFESLFKKDDEPKSTSDKSTWHKMVESQMLVGNKEYLDALMLDIRNRAIVDNIKIPTLYDPVKEINEAREPAIPYPDKEEKDKFNKVEEYLSKIVVDNASHFKIDASKSLEELERIHDYSIKNPKGPEELIKPIEKNADKLFAPGVKKYYFIEGDKFDTSSAKTFLEKYKISKDLKDTEGKLSEDVPTSDDDNVK